LDPALTTLSSRLNDDIMRLDGARRELLDLRDPPPYSLCDGCRVVLDSEERAQAAELLAFYVAELEGLYRGSTSSRRDEGATIDELETRRANLKHELLASLSGEALYMLGRSGVFDQASPRKPLELALVSRPHNRERHDEPVTSEDL
jgi:hypothetical protein